jgi:hypothetical protein
MVLRVPDDRLRHLSTRSAVQPGYAWERLPATASLRAVVVPCGSDTLPPGWLEQHPDVTVVGPDEPAVLATSNALEDALRILGLPQEREESGLVTALYAVLNFGGDSRYECGQQCGDGLGVRVRRDVAGRLPAVGELAEALTRRAVVAGRCSAGSPVLPWGGEAFQDDPVFRVTENVADTAVGQKAVLSVLGVLRVDGKVVAAVFADAKDAYDGQPAVVETQPDQRTG